MNQSTSPTQPARRNLACGSISLILLACFACLILTLLSAGNILVLNTTPQPVQAIVVLSGGEGERLDTAADYFNQGLARWVILVNNGIEDPGAFSSLAARLIYEAGLAGITRDQILVTRPIPANSTIGEAQAVLDLARNRSFTSLLVVTDPFHTLRTSVVYADIFKNTGISTTIVSAENHWYKPATWFFSLRGWQETTREYIKLLGYWLGYRKS